MSVRSGAVKLRWDRQSRRGIVGLGSFSQFVVDTLLSSATMLKERPVKPKENNAHFAPTLEARQAKDSFLLPCTEYIHNVLDRHTEYYGAPFRDALQQGGIGHYAVRGKKNGGLLAGI